MIIAGETSGDLHAASLMEEISMLDSTVEFHGIGGDKMITRGLHAIYHSDSMAFLGFTEVVRHLPFIARVKRDLIKFVKEQNIKTAVLVDYPGFNLNMAASLKKLGITVLYYISPQVWAWRKGRIQKIKKRVDMMMTVFPFEETMYKAAGIDAEFVGHPLIEQMDAYAFLSKAELYTKYDLENGKDILLVLPGSRKQEVERIFPAVEAGVAKIAKEFAMQVVVVCAPSIDRSFFEHQQSDRNWKVVDGDAYNFMKHAKFGIIKSGTSTLEAGLLGMPMIVVYKTSALTYAIGKRVIAIDTIGLVNIVLGKKTAPELIQDDLNAKTLYETAAFYLCDSGRYQKYKDELAALRGLIGSKTAAKRAAEIVVERLHEG